MSTPQPEGDGGPEQLVIGPSSFALKLFKASGPVMVKVKDDYGEEKITADSPISRVLSVLDIALHIVGFLIAQNTYSSRFHSVNSFGRTCTTIYPSAMSIMYRAIACVPLIWGVLLDGGGMLTYEQVNAITTNPDLLVFFLNNYYLQRGITVHGEDPGSYKLRRFFFICSRVQELWVSTRSLGPGLLAFLQQYLPQGRDFLFPATRKLTWREADPEESKISLRTSPIVINGFHAFRSTGLRWVDLELHDNSVPLCNVFYEKMFHPRIKGLVDRYLTRFPGLYAFNICIFQSYSSTNRVNRQILDSLHYVVLLSGATVAEDTIPLPPLTLPFCKGEWSTFDYKENITIDVITPRGVEPLGGRNHASDEHRILTALSLESSRTFALTYCTNMTTARISKKHAILVVLDPLLKKKTWQDVIIHLQSVEMCLFSSDLLHMANSWRQLRYLDLRFNVVHRNATDVPTIETVQTLTITCHFLEYLFLPELSTKGFRNNEGPIHAYGLRTLSSSVLHCDDGEAGHVAAALLDAYPTLAKVRLDVSALGWTPISQALLNLLSDRIRHQVATRARAQNATRAQTAAPVVRETALS